MKKFFMFIFCCFMTFTLVSQGWTSSTAEQVEYNAIMRQIAQINEYFTSMGAFRSSARDQAIFQFLKGIGTPVSYKILQELVSSGFLPASYLNQA